MAMEPRTDVGAHIGFGISTNALNDTGGTTNGAAVDRDAFGMAQSCVLRAQSGAASGTPTTQLYDAKLQDSADGSTGWADVTGAAVTQMAADDEEQTVDVNLKMVKRYLRVVRVVAFTGGSTPAWAVAETLVLGGPHTLALA